MVGEKRILRNLWGSEKGEGCLKRGSGRKGVIPRKEADSDGLYRGKGSPLCKVTVELRGLKRGSRGFV